MNSSTRFNISFFELPKFSLNIADTLFEKQLGVYGIWMVGWMCLLEYVVLWLRDKPLPPPHENLLSITHAIFHQLVKMWIRSVEYIAYVWLWKNFSLVPSLFSDSISSHVGTLILIDFCFYWFHRISHEVMLFWAIHQVHHSSLDLTIPVGLRHSPLQYLFSWVFYLPLAILGLPVSHLVAHLQLNLLYQTWIHTEAVDNLGPFEYVLNTPSHHRVHHGIFQHEIDKNFGGVLIIWDYIFGTLEKERNKDEKVYGIIYQPENWNIVYQQIFYMKRMIAKAKTMPTWNYYFQTFWKGPSWQPGASRTGRELEIIYDYSLNRIRQKEYSSNFLNIYICLHLVASLLILSIMTDNMGVNIFLFATYSLFILAALTNIGILYEGKSIANIIELFRCVLGFVFCMIFSIYDITHLYLTILYGASMAMWILVNCLNLIPFYIPHEIKKHIKKQ